MFEGNKQYDDFRDALNSRGVVIRVMFEAASGIMRRKFGELGGGRSKLGIKRPDVALVSFCIIGENKHYGTGPCPVVRLAVNTAFLIDYGEDGLGVWYEAKTNRIEDDISTILGVSSSTFNEKTAA